MSEPQASEPRAERRLRADGERSRRAILQTAARLATVEGLRGLSIGRLADEIGMSKSGLYAHFGSKEELQLATVDTAGEIFEREVFRPALSAPDGLDRLYTLCDAYLSYVERRVFPGGCFFAAAAAEFGTHPGPVRDRIVTVYSDWLQTFEALIGAAQDRGELAADIDAGQLAFEIDALLFGANASFVLEIDGAVLDRARTAIRTRIGAGAAVTGYRRNT
jgi:AcrR family transcriptional regulator